MLRPALAAAALLCAASIAYACPASYYAHAHHGRTMANGKPFNMHALTAAHRTYPFGTRLKVTYRGRSVVVTVTDRGPASWTGRCIDLSYGAAKALGMIRAGVGNVTITRQ
jgi:rare lipoprotein A